MVNQNIETVNFIYELKKVIVGKLFLNPAVLSDLIDMIHDEIERSIGLDHVKKFSFNSDGDYMITIETIDTPEVVVEDAMHIVIANSMMRFCCLYKTAIELALSQDAGKYVSDLFNLALETKNYYIMGQLFFATIFTTKDVCHINLRLY